MPSDQRIFIIKFFLRDAAFGYALAVITALLLAWLHPPFRRSLAPFMRGLIVIGSLICAGYIAGIFLFLNDAPPPYSFLDHLVQGVLLSPNFLQKRIVFLSCILLPVLAFLLWRKAPVAAAAGLLLAVNADWVTHLVENQLSMAAYHGRSGPWYESPMILQELPTLLSLGFWILWFLACFLIARRHAASRR